MTATGKRVNRLVINIVKKQCPKCGHDRAWNKPTGVFCSRCMFEFEKGVKLNAK